MTVKLRRIQEKDLQMILNWRMSPEVTKYMYTDPKLTIEDQKRWYDKIRNNIDLEKYWIIQLETGIDVGLLSVNHIDFNNNQCSWAYYIGDVRARGTGLGRILECNMYDYVLLHMGFNKLWCEVFEFNEKVIKIHQKFGSKIEGTFIDHIYKHGRYFNVIRMGIRKEEWSKLRSTYEYRPLQIEEY
ncbi:UDP-4-amino-4,6-dideoxy-N-acetyl-beta-L-altrosamine N-acetyltransferase [Priestia megaterium]|uniref:UDP-4-amino-4, 6-dideoxy-N-acetyl-beta-L-altrosamine N-acetyltransferase n=1 Tax=Priestia megaterium TaxID=1404 RepID=UPI00300A6CEA